MIVQVPLSRLKANPWQTKIGQPKPDYVRDLALSIAEHGLLQSPAGRLMIDDKPLGSWKSEDLAGWVSRPDVTVELAFGHGRWAAFQWLVDMQPTSNIQGDWSCMPVEISQLTDEQMAVQAWAENERRRDHTPIERAMAMQRAITDFHWTHEQVAEKFGCGRPTVSNALRLLKLPEDIQGLLQEGELSERHGAALLTLFDLPERLRTRAENSGELMLRPSFIVQAAVEGSPSDYVRKQVDKLVTTYGGALGEWPLEHVFDAVGGRPPCQECAFCLARGGRSYCGDILCFYDRQAAWRRRPQPAPAASPTPTPVASPPVAPQPPTPAPVVGPGLEPDKAEETSQEEPEESPAAAAAPAPTPVRPTLQPPAPAPARPTPALAPIPAPAQQPATPPAPPPDWEHSQIAITITLMPEDGNPSGRPCMIGLRANTGFPILRSARQAELNLPVYFTNLLDELKKAQFPEQQP